MRPSKAILSLIVIAMSLLVACGGSSSSQSSLPRGGEPVSLDPAEFVARIDHPYWPMAPGNTWVVMDKDLEGNAQRIEITVTNKKKRILGIDTTVIHDRVTENGKLVEDTYDWYAQDKDGNLWYFGEDTTAFENGKPNKAGSWQAGVDGAQAGVVIPAEPKVGQSYRQEYYAGKAEAAAKVVGLDKKVEVAAGKFDDVLMTEDTTRIHPDVLEHKFYARGVGPVLILGLSGGKAWEELVHFKNGSA
jgi:hypothetical protein